MSVEPFTNFAKRKAVNNKLNTTDPQYGLCLKTYNSDLYQNWINTEWIEGVDGINERKWLKSNKKKRTTDTSIL